MPLHLGLWTQLNILQRISYCFWWGLQNLSSLGQSLKTSTYVWEIYFSIFVSISGLLSFAFLIGNVQAYLLSEVARAEERRLRAEKMRSRRQELESWRFYHLALPENLKEKILEIMESKLQENILVDWYNILDHLPMDLRKDAIRHVGRLLLLRVPMFYEWDTQLVDAMCDSLKPVIYTEESYIFHEKGTVDSMIFIMHGSLVRLVKNGESNLAELFKDGDFCGEEVIQWVFDPRSSSNLPISTATVKSVSKVLALVIKAEDLKIVASQILQFHDIDHVRAQLRLYSREWRTWAANFIQAAWRRYYTQKLRKGLREEENRRLQDALANAARTSSSLGLGATIYASRFPANVLRHLRSGTPNAIIPTHVKKPVDII